MSPDSPPAGSDVIGLWLIYGISVIGMLATGVLFGIIHPTGVHPTWSVLLVNFGGAAVFTLARPWWFRRCLSSRGRRGQHD